MIDLVVDVVLRTYNRAPLIKDAVASLFAADASGIDFHLYIVDNASSDNTPEVLRSIKAEDDGRITLLHEAQAGGQLALNTAIAAGRSPVIAFFDDDERVDTRWLQTIRREFLSPQTDFIAGPCRPLWTSAEPDWMPKRYGGVLGIIDSGPERTRFSEGFAGMLTQGNCAVRRSIYDEVGPYPATLSTAEDRWLYEWLLRSDKVGFYCPDLVIDHIMQESRLSRAYFRSWAAREGRDRAVCDRLAGEASLLKQPWYWKSCAESLFQWCRAAGAGQSGSGVAFEAELHLRQMWAHGLNSLGL